MRFYEKWIFIMNRIQKCVSSSSKKMSNWHQAKWWRYPKYSLHFWWRKLSIEFTFCSDWTRNCIRSSWVEILDWISANCSRKFSIQTFWTMKLYNLSFLAFEFILGTHLFIVRECFLHLTHSVAKELTALIEYSNNDYFSY